VVLWVESGPSVNGQMQSFNAELKGASRSGAMSQ